MARHYTDGGVSYLPTGLAQTVTTMTVADASVFGANYPVYLQIYDAGSYPNPNDDPGLEIVRVTEADGNVLTVVRGQDGTSDTAHASGERVVLSVLAGGMNDLVSKTPDTSADNVIQAQAASATPLIIKGASGQTAPLLQIQTSAGSPVGTIGPSGHVSFVGAIGMFGAAPTVQASAITLLSTTYTTGDLDTESEIIAAINATNAAVNALIEVARALGHVATS